MSDLHNVRSLRAAALLALAAAAAFGEDAVAPRDLVVPLDIVSVPDTDTLALNDSLVLTVRSDSGAIARVRWHLVEREDVVEQDTLVYRPPGAGTEYVRAVAALTDGREGAAVRAVVTRRNWAPLLAIEAAPDRNYDRVPLGDTIELFASYEDPDGDAIPPGAVLWALEGEADSLHVGDTLHIVVDSVRTYRIRLQVTDAIGSTTTARHVSEAFDPIVPADWRRFVGFAGGVITETRSAVLVVNSGQKSDGGNAICECPVFGLATDGTRLWQVLSGSGAPPVPAGAAEVYFTGADGTLSRISDTGEIDWVLPGAVTGAVMFEDGSLAVLSTYAAGSARSLRRVSAQGQPLWEVPLNVARVHGAVLAQDSTTYVMASPTTTISRAILAVGPDGTLLWEKTLPDRSCCSPSPFVPADDSTVLAFSDSVYALRPDGSVRWTRPHDGGRAVVDLAGQAHQAGTADLVVYRLDNGIEVRRTPIDSGASHVSPILTADGAIIIASGSLVVALDAGNHLERWRHRLAGRVRDMLLTEAGLLVMTDWLGTVEGLTLSVGPLRSAWPQGFASSRRTGRAVTP